ncbi:MAG: hypothetical protein CVV47_06295 [Spirochaetae bacterium HGW-Spirochaetae-3]|jgi:diguanylate cyclase (GGDEF)-like protein|nr:MAG: hypothetical protein CVV47_06295 [Spirochaetae bacterium HGW-Spirochaetae-3]
MAGKGRSSLKEVIPLNMAVGTMAFCMVAVLSAYLLVARGFSTLERTDMEGRIAQFGVLLRRERESLGGFVMSYAEWGDSYDYLATRDPSYIEDNYPASWMRAQKIDAVLIVADDGEILWSSVAVPRADASSGVPRLRYRSPALFHEAYGVEPSRAVYGFSVFDGVPAMYVSWPVTDDLATLPPRGVLVFVRMLDDEVLRSYAPGDDFNVSWLPASETEKKPVPGIHPVKVDGRDELEAWDPVADADGTVIGYLGYHKDRSWLAALRVMLLQFFVIGAAAGLCAYLASYFFVKRQLVDPILVIRDYLGSFSSALEAGAALGTDRRDELGELSAHVNSLVDRVRVQARELDRLALTDGLTGLPNRRSLDKTLSLLRLRSLSGYPVLDSRSSDERGSVACGMIDVDFFKNYNDLYGHAGGDAALRSIGLVIRECVMRPDDLPSRYGGEEFAVLLPDTDEAGAFTVLERVRRAVGALELPHAGSAVSVAVTVSCGVAAVRPGDAGADMDALMAMADKALYAAKAAGRNRVTAYSSLAADAR